MKNRNYVFWGFFVLMIALGASDSLRGVFSVVFADHFGLTTNQVAQIVTVSYAGNLVFLLIGGRLTDRFERKKAMQAMLLIWMMALLLFVLSDNFYAVLIGMFLAMGASTLLSTTINIVTPLLFAATPGLAVNFLFFVQGVGTTGSQSLVGNFAGSFSDWKLTNGILLALGVVAFLFVSLNRIPDNRSEGEREGDPVRKHRFRDVVANRSFVPLVLLFGCYFIAEHGILNWLVAYGTNHLSLSQGGAANYLAVFFGGITVGRLIFSPLIDKLGLFRSITWFALAACVLYVTGILWGKPGLWLLSASGLFFSILYPTIVMMLQRFYPAGLISTATGAIISVASLFDIGFNFFFGKIIDMAGYERGFLILPVSMVLFVVIYLVGVRDKSAA
ncbi:MFS transporter [Paenibacillus macerans]|uniref:MFS transporter n=1 Tax=Paenibacillus macerans TaxID=44252 RepID=UPI003D31AA38